MAGNYKVVSLNPHCPSISKVDHGEFRSYAAAAGIARIVRRIWKDKTVLVEIPTVVKSDKIEFGLTPALAEIQFDSDMNPFHP